MCASTSIFQILEKYMWKSSFFTPINIFVKDFDDRFTKTLLDWGISRTGYFLGIPSVVVWKINIKNAFSVWRFSEIGSLYGRGHKSHRRTQSKVLNKSKIWIYSKQLLKYSVFFIAVSEGWNSCLHYWKCFKVAFSKGN